MKVLMFGWEFPPHITGGLGTACFGMTKGLAKNGVDVLFVVPKAHGDEDETNVRLLNASDVTVNIDNEKDNIYSRSLDSFCCRSICTEKGGAESCRRILQP